MKYVLIFFVISLIVSPINAQNEFEITGKVIDEFDMSVPYVNVGIENKNMGTATTEDGDFLFVVTKNELNDTLYVSSLGFKTYKIKVADYIKLPEKRILLKEDVVALDAVVLSKFEPEEYAQKALEKIKENTLSQTHQLELLFRRAATENGKARFFAENYIKVKDKGPSKRLGTVQVTQLRKSVDYRTWQRKQWTHEINYMTYNIPFRPSEKQKKLKDYTWKRTGDTSYEGEDVIILQGTHKKEKWNKMELYIGYDTHKVYKITAGRATYLYRKHTDGRMYLSYYQNSWGWGKKNIPEEYQYAGLENMQYKTEAFVYKVETDPKKIEVKAFGGDTDMASVDVPYSPAFWLNLKLPPDTKFYKKVKSEIESIRGVPLEKQYLMTTNK